MLMIANYENEEADFDAASQTATVLSDREIFERVSRIRRGWSVEERVERRKEAERRFAKLVDAIADAAAA